MQKGEPPWCDKAGVGQTGIFNVREDWYLPGLGGLDKVVVLATVHCACMAREGADNSINLIEIAAN